MKADDWLIFAQACVAGASYATLDEDAYVWRIHAGQLSQRAYDLMATENVAILAWIEDELSRTGRLTTHRRTLLAHYFAKQILFTYEHSETLFRHCIERIDALDSSYRLQHGNWLLRLCASAVGLKMGIPIYMGIKRLLGKGQRRQSGSDL